MSGPHGLTAGDKLALASLAFLGIFGDALLDAILRADWHRLAVFGAVAFSALLLAFSALSHTASDDWTPSRTAYLSRDDAERAAR